VTDVIVVSSLVDDQGQGDLSGAVGAAALARGPSRPIRAEWTSTGLQTPRELAPAGPCLCVAALPMPRGPVSFTAPLTFPGPGPVLSFISYLANASTKPTDRPRRSHANDVNPQQLRHVHKPPAHKSPRR
jgi:hypothetical protein